MSKYSGLFTSVNILLGTGPIILPMPFFQTGIGLSIIWMVCICFFSYQTAMYISQSMSKLSLLDNKENKDIQQINDDDDQSSRLLQLKGDYNHVDQFQVLFGKNWRVFPSVCITIYLLGASVSKCIMTGKIMSSVFDSTSILKQFWFWVAIFFVSGAAFSFQSIQKTKIIQIFMIGMRSVSILMFLFGSIYLFCRDGPKQVTPYDGGAFNFSNFTELFSNSVFSLMLHHSFPLIVNKYKQIKDVQFVVKYSILISGLILLVIPVTGSLAFGQQLVTGGEKLKYYNLDFKEKINFIYWFTSFYTFMNVAAFSVYIIVVRANILGILTPSIQSEKVTKQTIFTSFIVLILILGTSLLLKNEIQSVLNFTGGVFGIIILFIIPCIQVYFTRKRTETLTGLKQSYFGPIIIGALGVLSMALTLYHMITKV